MSLNNSTGNMYEFVTHTWNTIKGECFHDCSYCYMKRWGKLNPVRFDERELKTDLGHDNFIFVGSGCDMLAENIPAEWILKTLAHAAKFDNRYLFQTKNPRRFFDFENEFRGLNMAICTTIETNRIYPEIMKNSPPPAQRADIMNELAHEFTGVENFVTIEPILDFDMNELVYLIETALPKQVNIGADTGKHNLPEPTAAKVIELTRILNQFTTVHRKKNLTRILKS